MVWTVLFNKLLWFGSQLPEKDKKPSAKIEDWAIYLSPYHRAFLSQKFYVLRSQI